MLIMNIILIFVMVLPTAAFAQPQITFDTEVYDFGIVSGDKPLQHTFEVTNSGTEDLIIQKLYAP